MYISKCTSLTGTEICLGNIQYRVVNLLLFDGILMTFLSLIFRCSYSWHSRSLEHQHYTVSTIDDFLVPHGFIVQLFSEVNHSIRFLAKSVQLTCKGR